jgi:hypothetical protein
MAAEAAVPSRRSRWTDRWRSWLVLGILGAFLTLASLIIASWEGLPGRSSREISAHTVEETRLVDEVRKLGCEAHVLDWEWKSGVFGRYRGRALLSVSFFGKSLADETLALLVQKYGDRLSFLEISNAGITDRSLRHFAALPIIKELRLENTEWRPNSSGSQAPLNKVTDAGLAHVQGLTTLKNLSLRGLPISDEGLYALSDLPSLEVLYLDRTKVRGPGLGRLKSLSKLRAIVLDGSTVTDEGLSHLAGASRLESLSLAGVPLTERGLEHLKSLPRLIRLDIRGCGLSAKAIDRFQVAFPVIIRQ